VEIFPQPLDMLDEIEIKKASPAADWLFIYALTKLARRSVLRVIIAI